METSQAIAQEALVYSVKFTTLFPNENISLRFGSILKNFSFVNTPKIANSTSTDQRVLQHKIPFEIRILEDHPMDVIPENTIYHKIMDTIPSYCSSVFLPHYYKENPLGHINVNPYLEEDPKKMIVGVKYVIETKKADEKLWKIFCYLL